MRYSIPGFPARFVKTREIHDERAVFFGAILASLAPAGPEAWAVCELGCGSGYWTEFLAARTAHVWAFDGSPRMLAAARHRMRKQGIQNFEFARADIRAIPLAGQVADLVFLSWVLPPFVYSFSDAAWRGELDTAIREMFRICKPGGSIRILTPSWRGKRDYQSILCNEFTFSERQVRLRWKFSSRRQARRALCLWFGKKTWKRWRYLWSNGVLVESSFWHISK